MTFNNAGPPRPVRERWLRRLVGMAVALAFASAIPAVAQDEGYCGDEGVWLQILGSGGSELTDQRSTASYLVWVDDTARLMVDAGSGAALRFDETGADMAGLDAIVFTHLGAATTADLPALLEGSIDAGRKELLPVFGPSGNDRRPAIGDFVERLIGEGGAYSELAAFLTFRNVAGYKLSVREVQATGQRRWSRFSSDDLKLSAIPVHHGGIPALAWRVEVGEFVIVFAGSFSNQKDRVADFAKGADALVVSHAAPEAARGELREYHAIPSQLGRIAARAEARILVLGNRTSRTLGRESLSREAIEQHFTGPLVFANELECWGLPDKEDELP